MVVVAPVSTSGAATNAKRAHQSLTHQPTAGIVKLRMKTTPIVTPSAPTVATAWDMRIPLPETSPRLVPATAVAATMVQLAASAQTTTSGTRIVLLQQTP